MRWVGFASRRIEAPSPRAVKVISETDYAL